MARDSVTVNANIDGLEQITRMLKDDYTVKIGIIGSKATAQHDSKSNLTNAQIGEFHEFGTSKMAQRSFLRLPLEQKLPEEIQKLKKVIWKQFFVKNAVREFYQNLGSIAIDIIEDYFNNSGYGEWAGLKSYTTNQWEKKKGITGWRTAKSIATFRKGLEISSGRQILTDTGKMRRSISFKVQKRGS